MPIGAKYSPRKIIHSVGEEIHTVRPRLANLIPKFFDQPSNSKKNNILNFLNFWLS